MPTGVCLGALLLAGWLACFYLALRCHGARLGAAEARQRTLRERLYLRALDAAPDAALIAGRDGRCLYANQAVNQALGRRKSQLIGHPALPALFPDPIQARAAARLLAEAGSYQGEASHEVQGRQVIAEVSLQALGKMDGAGAGQAAFIAIVRDISERRQEADDLLHARHQLQRQASAQRRLLAEQTHFNQDLQAELAQRAESQAALAGELRRQTLASLHLLGQLMDIQARAAAVPEAERLLLGSRARLEALALLHACLHKGGQVDFARYVEALGASLCRRHARPGLAPGLHADISCPWLRLDAALPCCLIVNELIANALMHAFAGREGPASIQVSLHRQGAGLALAVRDDGMGLAPSARPAAGLAIVQAMAGQLGGQLRLEGGRGAAVAVDFPYRALG